jgi:hypothetical protein
VRCTPSVISTRHCQYRAVSIPRQHLLLSVFVLNVIWTNIASSQHITGAFGSVIDTLLTFEPRAMVASSATSTQPAEILVAAAEGSRTHLYHASPAGFRHVTRFNVRFDFEAFAPFRGTTSGRRYAALSLTGESFSILETGEKSISESVYPASTESQRIAVYDINGDNREDVLLFGKRRSGVSTFLSRTDGSLVAGPVLFPDLSVADLSVGDLNGDGIADILLLNWLSNELAVYYGIGQLVFSEQVSVALPGEPSELAISTTGRHRTLLTAITLPEQSSIVIHTGNSLGEYELLHSMHLREAPTGVRFVDLDGDGLDDLVVSTHRTIQTVVATGRESFSPPVEYGAGSEMMRWALADIDRNARKDLVILDRQSRRLAAVQNASHFPESRWSNHYAVGRSPHGLAVRDFDGNGHFDIATANTGSSSISVLKNSGKGAFHPQQVRTISEDPEYMRAVVSPGAPENRVVVTHPSISQVSLVAIHNPVYTSPYLNIPTGESPYVVFARSDPGKAPLQILVRYTHQTRGAYALSLFEQIPDGRFLERSIRPASAANIVALTVDDMTRNGRYDLIFATHDRTSRTTTVSIAYTEAHFDFATVRTAFTFKDTLSSTVSLIAGDLNGDPYKDIVVVLGPPGNAIGISHGLATGTM